MRYLILCVIAVSCVKLSFSQHTLEGTVKNIQGEKLLFATVYLVNTPFASATDENGYFKISNIPAGEYECKITYLGYAAHMQTANINQNMVMDVTLSGEIYNLDQIEIQANRTNTNGIFTKTNLSRAYLQKENLGQDVPFLLQWTPSMIVTSDAGSGIGYTSMRIRGTDQTRINVTINGVPLNDAESQNVFWVDLPDMMGSVKNIQIQRGVGTSSNGAGAFGGTVSISTHDHRVNPYLDLAAGYGSFDTKKIQVSAGTGVLNRKYFIDGRVSYILSDGYIDRASSDLSSLYFSAGKISDKSSLRLNIMMGNEVTYQAWYGTPESKLFGNISDLNTHYQHNLNSIYKTTEDSLNLFGADRRYNYYIYPNQIDKYRQTHYQAIWATKLSSFFKLKTTLFYTHGHGYYEESKPKSKFKDYGLKPLIVDGKEIKTSDIIRRRWLDNDFYGGNADIEYNIAPAWMLNAGLNISKYVGQHFGNIVSSSVSHPDHNTSIHYYDNQGNKEDFTTYMKLQFAPSQKFNIFSDIQWRKVNYTINGLDNDLRPLEVSYSDVFINPKIGLHYTLSKAHQFYLSYAVGQKEPSRGDFIDRVLTTLPKAEKLHNVELGMHSKISSLEIENNIYYMWYRDQLVLTGEINDVGAPIRINVPDSYRLGWENSITYMVSKQLSLHSTFTISRNRIKNFKEVIADYTNGLDKKAIYHSDKEISFSPALTGLFQILYRPVLGLEVELSSKYVSRQYLDNTSDEDRSIPAYNFQNIRLSKQIESKWWRQCAVTLMINNILNKKYVSNGYSYTYIYEKPITENFYYPQAGTHFMVGVVVGF